LSTVERDVTERNRYERQLRQLNRDLQIKGDEMEQFAYIVSHDLKSPLVTMIGFVGILREELDGQLSEGAADSMRRIENAATRMSQLIDDLLELGRVGHVKGESEEINLASVVDELRMDLASELERVGAKVVLDGLPVAVRADPRRFYQVMQNLVSNAIKYGCDDGDKRIRIGAVEDKDETRVYVRDTGPGIAPEYQERIFRLFEQGQSGRGGTGVGLALVAKIARAHGGDAWVDSTPGQGATFWVSFARTG
jgi:signal transduction histidine kinase